MRLLNLNSHQSEHGQRATLHRREKQRNKQRNKTNSQLNKNPRIHTGHTWIYNSQTLRTVHMQKPGKRGIIIQEETFKTTDKISKKPDYIEN